VISIFKFEGNTYFIQIDPEDTDFFRIVLPNFWPVKDDSERQKVLEAVNQDLIQELMNIDNYLTGILLQFEDDMVEYANAAHTQLLVKRSYNNNVKMVNLQDDDFRGMFLGVPDMQQRYATLKFKVKPGDMLLLYSDCLIEQKNIDKEEYGIERLVKAFQRAPKNTPSDVMDYILQDFEAFRNEEPYNDDLTILILKKSG